MMIGRGVIGVLLLACCVCTAGIATASGTGTVSVEDPDRREMLRLPPDERHIVLQEMRNFVVAMQAITAALAVEDMQAVAEAAQMMGSGAANEIPPHVVAKLPEPFRILAGKVHTTFDAIALDSQGLGDTSHTLGQVGELMQHCVACHGLYQLERERPQQVAGQ